MAAYQLNILVKLFELNDSWEMPKIVGSMIVQSARVTRVLEVFTKNARNACRSYSSPLSFGNYCLISLIYLVFKV